MYFNSGKMNGNYNGKLFQAMPIFFALHVYKNNWGFMELSRQQKVSSRIIPNPEFSNGDLNLIDEKGNQLLIKKRPLNTKKRDIRQE